MAQELRVPDVGEGLTEVTIVRWLVPVGGQVAADRPVVEVETDKALMDIPVPFPGVVLHHGAAEGDVLAVGDVLVVLGEQGEVWSPDLAAASPAGPDQASAEAPPIVGTLSEGAVDLGPADAAAPGPANRPKALPAVRKLARELGVDLATVVGTGPDGQITSEDVRSAADR